MQLFSPFSIVFEILFLTFFSILKDYKKYKNHNCIKLLYDKLLY